MSSFIRILLIACVLLSGACSNSDQMTTKERADKAMSRIPKDLRVFDGYVQTMDKANNFGGDVQKMAETQRKMIDQAERRAGQ